MSLIDDGGRWRSSQDGPPLPFEELDAYRARRVEERLAVGLLLR